MENRMMDSGNQMETIPLRKETMRVLMEIIRAREMDTRNQSRKLSLFSYPSYGPNRLRRLELVSIFSEVVF